MELNLRIAEKQGVLQNRSLSIVQYLSIQVLLDLDRKQKGKDDSYNFKLAAMGGDPAFVSGNVESLFPEWFETSIMNDPILGPIEEGSITYVAGEEEMTGEAMEAILAQMRKS